jgi:hypothetical protein
MANIPLPSIDVLMAFESAARHQSFTRSTAELNPTQGAISRQIRLLEDRLGPKASINCGVRLSPFDFETDPFDAAIHYGAPIWAWVERAKHYRPSRWRKNTKGKS